MHMIFDNFPKVAPAGMAARVFLAFLATAGLFYINILPTIVDGLIQALGFTNQQAGAVASANIYGAASGALLIVFLVRHINWRFASLLFLLALIGIDLASIYVSSPMALVAIRFLDGFVGGMLVGTGFSVIARTAQPDRTFGVLLFVQYGLGGLGVMFIPGLVPEFGTSILFLSLIAFSMATLLMLPFLPAFPVEKPTHGTGKPQAVRWVPLCMALAALFLFQAANNGLYAYIIGLGEFYGMEQDFITTTLGISAWLGAAGAVLVIMISDRFGYFKTLLLGIGLTTVANWALQFSDMPLIFFAANVLVGITWAFSISYLLGLASRFDASGQMAALGGFASKMGLASGPAVAALIMGKDNYELIIWVAVGALVLCMLMAIAPSLSQDRHVRGPI
jgi:predicted MFS family arabinose efflux permease